MPLRLRITGDGLRITGSSSSPSGPSAPSDNFLLTETGDVVVTETGEPLLMESPR